MKHTFIGGHSRISIRDWIALQKVDEEQSGKVPDRSYTIIAGAAVG